MVGRLGRLARSGILATAFAASLATPIPIAPRARAAGSVEPCNVRVEVHPERPFVGQQILYVVRISRSGETREVEWIESLRFSGFRSEWLPGSAERKRPGPRYVREERVALFAAQAGPLELPGGRLRCRLRDGSQRELEVAARRLEVRAPPLEKRPASWKGLIGPVTVARTLRPDRMSLGGTTLVSIQIRGATNVWDWALESEPLARRAEVFARPPQLTLEPGERLYAQLLLRHDLVPRETGSLELPAIRVPYFDPDKELYDSARAPALRLGVEAKRGFGQPPTGGRGEHGLTSRSPRKSAGRGEKGDPIGSISPHVTGE